MSGVGADCTAMRGRCAGALRAAPVIASAHGGPCEADRYRTGEVLCRIEDRVGVVTLNRPDARNALTLEMKQALAHWIPALGADPEVGCLLLTGAGSAFCSGGDTKRMARDGKLPSPAERTAQLRWEHGVPLVLHTLPKPTLAALPGPAAGAGFALALACDLRIAAESTFVTTAYARLGLSGDYGSSWFLTRLVGPAKAREILFTAERLDARTCERIGLVNRVVADAELERPRSRGRSRSPQGLRSRSRT